VRLLDVELVAGLGFPVLDENRVEFLIQLAGRVVGDIEQGGGSSKQALAVAAGLEADVVTMNQSTDLDILVERGGLVAADWRERFPHGATPYTTTSVFLVRQGNPKHIHDWADLARPGLSVIVPNPKTSGNGRYTYLAAWGSVIADGGTDEQAREFVRQVFANVPVLDGGGRGATTTFTQRDIGDVLVTFENEAALIARELGADQFDGVGAGALRVLGQTVRGRAGGSAVCAADGGGRDSV
jgi:sulfate/thiosulfate transport system substrate-binding protein